MGHIAVLHLGSNLGDRKGYLQMAYKAIDERIGKILAYSKVYNTEAWGKADQPDYLNAAVLVQTDLSAAEIIDRSKDIESEAGTVDKQKWAERKLDIDLLFYGQEVIQTEKVRVPHPFIHKRNLVLVPLMDIIPFFVHPQLHRTIEELYFSSRDPLKVTYHSEAYGHD